MRQYSFVWLLAIFASGALVPVGAEEPAAGEVQRLVEELDANRFTQRQSAQQKLQEAGPAVFPELEKAVESNSRERSSRALDILKRHFTGADDAAKAAAKESLGRLGKSQNPAVAKQAAAILNPPEAAPPPDAAPPLGLPGPRIGPIQMQFQFGGGGGGGFRRVSMKSVNGVKQIEAEENGRKVNITDDPNNGIKMEVKETKDGKEEVKKYEAKDAAELKTKHPEAHKLYEEYAKQPGGFPAQGFGGIPLGALPPGALPPGFPGGPLNPQRIKILGPQELNAAKEKLATAIKGLETSLETVRQASEKNESLKKTLEQLEETKKQLQQLKDSLEN